MKKIKRASIITILLSLLILVIYCIIDQNKSASALFETDSKYIKYNLPEGLNIISIDLGGLISSNRENGSYGDATLIEQNGNYLLIDTGNRTLDDDGNEIDNNVLINFLKSQKVKNLDIYISHYHSDHYGKVEALLKDSYFTINNVYLLDPRTFTGRLDTTWKNQFNNWFTNFKQKLLDLGANIIFVKKTVRTTGQTNEISIGEAKLKVIWDFLDCDLVSDDFTADKLGSIQNHFMNDTSLVAMITYKGKRFLMAGDMEERIETRILESGLDVKADIFKLSHHGGVSSNLSAFIDKVNPVYAYMPNNSTALKNNPTFWMGDRTYSFVNYEGITYNENVTRFKNYGEYIDNLGSKTDGQFKGTYDPTLLQQGAAAHSGMVFGYYTPNVKTVVHEMAHNVMYKLIDDRESEFAREKIVKFMEFATGFEKASWRWQSGHNYPVISSATYSDAYNYIVAAATQVCREASNQY